MESACWGRDDVRDGLPQIALTTNQDDWCGGGLESEIGNPVVDSREQTRGITDVVAQEEHVSLPVGQAPGGVGLHGARGVPDGVPHPPRADHRLVHVAAERGRYVVLEL